MTLATEPAPAPTVGVVVMTKDEARACVERIKALSEELAPLLMDLRDREGWRALGYKTWQECLKHEFQLSRQRAHQLINSHIVERVLTSLPPGPASTMVDAGKLNERQKRELMPLVREPVKLAATVAKVQAEKGDDATAVDYHEAVGEQIGRPVHPERRSVSSRAERGDFEDSAPDYADQSQDVGEPDPNNEPHGRADATALYCTFCMGHDHREDVCPHRPAPAPDGDPFDGLTPHPDGVSAPILADTLTGDPAPTPDQTGAAGPSAEADTPSDTEPAPPSAPPTGRGWSEADGAVITVAAREAGRSNPASAPASPAPSSTVRKPSAPAEPRGYQPVRVDGQTPMSVYPSADGFLNGVESHLAGDQLDEFAGRFAAYYREVRRRRAMVNGQPMPADESAAVPALREALAGDDCTILSLTEAIGDTFTVDARASLLALLADAMPAERLGPLAHRLTVRTRNTGDLIEPEPIAEPTLADLDTDERRAAMALELLKQCSSKTVLAAEAKLPMIRKEVGARERASAATAEAPR